MGTIERIDREQRAAERSAERTPAPTPPADGFGRDGAGEAAPVTVEADSDGHAAQPRITVLENGMTVLTQADARFPLASIRLYVRAGSGWETEREAGISHFLEHMAFKGTDRRAPGQVAGEIEGAGGSMNAGTSFDYTVYYVDVPKDAWRLGIDILHDMTVNPSLDPDEFESERQVVVSEIEMGEDTPGRRQFKALQEMVWPETSYGRPIIGFRETLAEMTPGDMRAYLRRLYQPRSMLLVAVGDIDHAEVLQKTRTLFGPLRNQGPLTRPVELPLPLFSGPVVRVEHGNWNKAYLSVAFPVPGLKRQEAVGLELLAQLLGGGQSARLPRRFKYEEQMVDQVSAFSMTLERGGMFVIQAVCDADKAETFVRALAEDLAGLSPHDFGSDEMARAKLQLEDSLYRSKETISGLAGKLGYFTFFEDGQVSEDNYLFSLRTADAETLGAVMDAYLRSDRLAAVLLLPEGTELSGDALAEGVREIWASPAETAARHETGARGEVEVVELDGGVSVVLMPDATLPYAAMDIVWPGGGVLEPQGAEGLAAFTSNYLGKGAGGRTTTQLQDYLADRAASVGASARRDAFSVSARYPARFAAEVLPIVRDMILDPAFSGDELGRVRQEQLAAIKQREDQPLGLAFRRIFPFLFEGPGYGTHHLGIPESVSAFQPDDAKAFFERQRSAPFVLSACGVFEREAVLELARDLAARTGPRRSVEIAPPVWKDERQATAHLPGRNQTHLVKIFPAPGLNSPDAPALALLKEALAGQSGILFRELRDRQGLGYSVTAMLWQTPDSGFLAFYIGTDPDKAEQALAGFEETVESLSREPLPVAEVERAQNLMRGDYWRDRQTLGSRSGEAAGLKARGLPLDFNETLLDKAGKATPEDVAAVASRILRLDKAYLFTVTP